MFYIHKIWPMNLTTLNNILSLFKQFTTRRFCRRWPAGTPSHGACWNKSPNSAQLSSLPLPVMMMMNNEQILREHSDSVLASESDKLDPFDLKSFDKAISWAKRILTKGNEHLPQSRPREAWCGNEHRDWPLTGLSTWSHPSFLLSHRRLTQLA